MTTLREEIIQEAANPRVDKKRLFDLLVKIVDHTPAAGGGGVGPRGEKGDRGEKGEKGDRGPVGPAAAAVKSTTANTPAKKTTTKKKVAFGSQSIGTYPTTR